MPKLEYHFASFNKVVQEIMQQNCFNDSTHANNTYNYRKTGILVFGEDYLMQSTINSLEANGIAFEKFSGEEVSSSMTS